MPKVNPNYVPLMLCVDPQEEPWSSRELRVLAVGMSKWEWVDPIRRTQLPSLVEFTGDDFAADVIVRWEDDMGQTSTGAPILGSVDTDFARRLPVIMRLSRKLFTEVDPTNWSRAVQHEIGHALGLKHSDGGVMKSINLDSAPISQANREAAAAFRCEGVVGVVD